MNVQDVSTLISTLGFPIVACGALFWSNLKTSDHYTKTIDEMRKTIEDNTRVTEQLITKLSDDKGVDTNDLHLHEQESQH